MQTLFLSLEAQYFPVFVFFAFAVTLSCIIIAIPYVLAKFRPSKAKLSPYECGFDPFGDARNKFDIRFYLVAILFIIFDVEIAFLIPWSLSLSKIGMVGFWSMILFLGVLTIGLWYEWKKGALDWE